MNTTQLKKTQRIYSLDSLRAIMMLLGVVLHSAATYAVIDFGDNWPLKDVGATSLSNDFIGFLIHFFRMQIFFVIAGFFGAMLFYERSPKKMVVNRIKRIVLPFIVFMLLLWPIIVFLIIRLDGPFYTGSVTYTLNSWIDFIPQKTFHLWFLYYLALITFVSVGVALLVKRFPSVSNYVHQVFDKIIQKPILRIFAFATITAISYFCMGTDALDTAISLVPDIKIFVYYFTFYLMGWLLYKSKEHLNTFMIYDRGLIILGLLLFCIYFFMNPVLPYGAKNILNALITWLFIFGITGVFIRYGSKHSAVMRYISDASYWVYLVHLPFTIYLPTLLFDIALPATVKFLIVTIVTGFVCVVSYHYLVRSTFIGKFLNGRKYSRKLSDIKDIEKEPELKPALD